MQQNLSKLQRFSATNSAAENTTKIATKSAQ